MGGRVMERLTERVEYVHVSLRIPLPAKNSVDEEARQQHLNFNSLVSKILEKHISFDKIAEDLNAISLDGLLFSEMLEAEPLERLEQLGEELGAELVKQTFVFLGLEHDIYGLIRHYFETMAAFSGWYSFAIVGSGSNRKLMFEHHYGPKWSAFLKAYISSIIRTATGSEHRVTMDDSIVTVYC
jgi:hypothetical protein